MFNQRVQKIMKTKTLIAASLFLVAGMAGCAKSDDSSSPGGGEEQTIVVKLPDNVGSRAVEEPQSSVGTSLDDVTVFLLSGQLVERAEVFSTDERNAKYKRIEQVPGSINKVIVVANANGAPITGLNTANAVYNYAFTVASQYPALKTGLEGKTLIGDGVPTVKTPDPDPGHASSDHIYKEVTVALEAITSRIEVGHVKMGTGIEELELLAVYINNYYEDGSKANVVFNNETSTYWPVLPAFNSENPISYTVADITTDYSQPLYMDKYSSDVELDADSKAYSYHVFSNNIPHLILMVKGKYTDEYSPIRDGTDIKMPYFLGWVTYKKFHTGPADNDYLAEMLPNNIYKMGVGLTGITINAPEITPKPEPVDYDLGIEVTVTPWVVNEVTPEV